MPTSAPPLIRLYNRPFPGLWEKHDCGGLCNFTWDRRRIGQTTAVVFHIPTLRSIPLPPKCPGQQWVAASLESEVNYPELVDPAFMRQFEITMTYRSNATVWWPYFGPDTEAALLTPPRPKTESSPMAYFRSSPVDCCGRTAYAAALMRRVKVDSYGSVLHNRDLLGSDKGCETMMRVAARYKFVLALENSLADDYVSEKYFCALASGSVPVYRGAPNVASLAPAEHCFINAADFAGPVELAAYLNRLNEQDDAYEAYLALEARRSEPAVPGPSYIGARGAALSTLRTSSVHRGARPSVAQRLGSN